MLEELRSFWEGHIVYVFLGVSGLVGLGFLWRWLNRPGRQEVEHQKRFQELQEKSRHRYKDLRPLK